MARNFREKIINHINDQDLKNKILKIIDKALAVKRDYTIKSSDFLNPYEVDSATAAVNFFGDLSCYSYGGYENAERKIFYICPDYMELDEDDFEIGRLEIRGNFKFTTVSHRDYLGSILSLGITRDKIGDILIHDDCCQVIVSQDVKDFIMMNLEKVKKSTVKIREIKKDEIKVPEMKFKDVNSTVSSLRVDSVIASGFNLSRKESTDIVKNGLVQVNYEPVFSPSRELEEGDLISVRRKGRFYLDSINGTTKKDRIKINIKILL